MSLFQRATMRTSKLCMAIIGGPGTGKTYTSLKVASHLGERICLIDAEHGRGSLYSREFDYDTAVLTNFHPRNYMHYIHSAQAEEYDVIIVDGITPEWDGDGGCLALVDDIQRRGGDKVKAWGQVTPLHTRFVRTLLSCRAHLICTIRGREKVVVDRGNDGQSRAVKLGVGMMQQEKIGFEFPVIGMMDPINNMQIVKTACHELKGALLSEPGEDLARILMDWLEVDDAVARPTPLSNEQVRGSIGAAMSAGEWSEAQVRELLRAYDAEEISELGDVERRRVVNTLAVTAGRAWVLSRSAVQKQAM